MVKTEGKVTGADLSREKICQYVWATYVDATKAPFEMDEGEALRFFEKFYSKHPLNEDKECFFFGILLYEQAFQDEVNRARYLVKAREVFHVYRKVSGDSEWDAVEDRLADVQEMIQEEGLEEKVKAAAASAPEIPGMVLVAGGSFPFGPDGEETVLEPFYIDVEPVTNGSYREFVAATNYRPPTGWESRPDLSGSELPVTGVSWMDALQYCKWKGTTLPTIQQWEKASRGTSGNTYPWGEEEPTPERVNCHWNRHRDAELKPVTEFPTGASPYGVLGMVGGVWEWTNTSHPDHEGSQFIKGGSYVDPADPRFVVASAFLWAGKKTKVDILGFRCTKALIL